MLIPDERVRQKISLLLNNVIIFTEGNDAASLDGFSAHFLFNANFETEESCVWEPGAWEQICSIGSVSMEEAGALRKDCGLVSVNMDHQADCWLEAKALCLQNCNSPRGGWKRPQRALTSISLCTLETG